MSVGARAVIRLGAIRHNLRRTRELAGTARIIAVIKANAYGHGLVPVAGAVADADAVAVARMSEAIALRQGGVEAPILVLQGAATPDDMRASAAHRLELVVHCEPQVELVESAARGRHVVWLKVDTGMRRLGVEPQQAGDLIGRLAAAPAVEEVRLMTHLAGADERGDPPTARQLECFAQLLDDFGGQYSIANSAGILAWPASVRAGREEGRSWVRAGIALYGVSPFAGTVGRDFGLEPAMDLEARIIAVKPVRAGEAVGYGGTWRAPRDTRLGIVSAGYGDGYSRHLPSGTPVLVAGREASLAGRVSMDSIAVDLGPQGQAAIGDQVVLWGEGLPVENIAARAGTIPYTLLTGVTHREPPDVID